MLYKSDENIWDRADRKTCSVGGVFKIPTKISPKPRIRSAKKIYGLMGHYNRNLSLKLHDD
jgi:hypothetical protein